MSGLTKYLQREDVGTGVVLSFRSPIRVDAANIREIQEELRSLLENTKGPKVILQADNILYLYSGFLGELIALHRRLEEERGELLLSGLRPEIQRIFELTSLDHFFHIYPNRDAALSAMG